MTIWEVRRVVDHSLGLNFPPQIPLLSSPGTNTHLTAHAKAEALVLTGDASNHGHRADAQRLPKLDSFLLNLLGQLSRGCQDDGVGTLV